MSVAERFWSKVDKSGDCWLWLGARTAQGYGSFKIGPDTHVAHRVAYALTFGPIRKGRLVRHSCDNPPCCNPAHLLLGTDADNIADKVDRGRQAKGEGNGRAKLTADDVRAIRVSHAAGVAVRSLAAMYGVHPRAIDYIVQRVNWKSVSDPVWRTDGLRGPTLGLGGPPS